MIEPEVWSRFNAEQQLELKRALVALSKSGILESQAQLELRRLVEGDAAQDAETLAKDILRVRADTRGLQNLHQYGLQLTQEVERNTQS